MSLLDKFKKKKEQTQAQDQSSDPKSVEEKPKIEPIKESRPVRVINKRQTVKAYKIIQEPHITEKATWLADQNKHVFKVYKNANKIEIKKAIEVLYSVKVDNVRIIHSAPKKRRLGRHEGWRKGLKQGFKKAVVTLKKGQKIEVSAS